MNEEDILKKKRNELNKRLNKWFDKKQKGKTLFVDAPMGLGKTHSVIKILTEKKALSAIIFMPTRRLCEEICNRLVGKMESDNSDSNNRSLWEQHGVYYFDGINFDECPDFNQIIDNYKQHYFAKNNICNKCERRTICRFLQHDRRAPEFRIIVATHAMYDHIFNSHIKFQWSKKEGNKVERDMFIIDEDIIFSKCYQPIEMDTNTLKIFSQAIITFLKDSDYFKNNEVSNDIFLKIYSLLGYYMVCDTTSYIPPIDYKFSFPTNIKKQYKQYYMKEQVDILELNELEEPVGDYLAIIENGIKKGFVVQNYKGVAKKAYFPNPRQYQFDENTPAHIFLDGTVLDKKLLKVKLRGAIIERFELMIDKPTNIKVFQNINNDLSKSKLLDNECKIKEVLNDIINEHGIMNKYLIITSKPIEDRLKLWLAEAFPNNEIIIAHYGNLRGLNDAQECNIAIMLGSYILSDAVEIAIALDFIYKNFKFHQPIAIKTENNFWTWQGSKGVKRYKKEFEIIEEVAKSYRYAEYRQALARTRYLTRHLENKQETIIFYVFSKDKINEYEPYISNLEEEQYRSDVFPPTAHKPAPNEALLRENIRDWLTKSNFVSATCIYNNYGKRRQSVATCLKKMVEEGILKQYQGYKKRFVYTDNNKT